MRSDIRNEFKNCKHHKKSWDKVALRDVFATSKSTSRMQCSIKANSNAPQHLDLEVLC